MGAEPARCSGASASLVTASVGPCTRLNALPAPRAQLLNRRPASWASGCRSAGRRRCPGRLVVLAGTGRDLPNMRRAAQHQVANLKASLTAMQHATLEAAEKAKDKDRLKAEVEVYRVGLKVFRLDIWRSAKVYAEGGHVSHTGLDGLRMRRAREDSVAMLGFLFFALNTVPLTPFLLPAALEVIPSRWLLPSSFSASRVRAMQVLDKRRKSSA